MPLGINLFSVFHIIFGNWSKILRAFEDLGRTRRYAVTHAFGMAGCWKIGMNSSSDRFLCFLTVLMQMGGYFCAVYLLKWHEDELSFREILRTLNAMVTSFMEGFTLGTLLGSARLCFLK